MKFSSLNQEQLSAVKSPFGYNLVIASAGTGKTSTIVSRIAYILEQGIDPKSVMLLTFTSKAAAEMCNRLSKIYGKKIIEQIKAGTFHSVCYKLLKDLGFKINIKKDYDLKILLKSICDKYQKSSSMYNYSYLYDIYSLYFNTCLDGDFCGWFVDNYSEERHDFVFLYEEILKEFTKEKQKYNYYDFNDLLITAKNHLKHTKFSEILVDEYQDTNMLQSSILDTLDKQSLFCVGDYDQSIYAFNGASIDIIGSFSKRYKNANIYTLNKNYRSTKSILALANKVISLNERLYEKKLEVTKLDRDFTPKLKIYQDQKEQFEQICKNIQESKISHNNIAVIYRNNSSADSFEAILRLYKIKAQRKGGNSFFDRMEIRLLCDLAFLCENDKDIMAFLNIFEHSKATTSKMLKTISESLLALGDGSIKQGLISPKRDILLDFAKKQNDELGLFAFSDEFDYKKKFIGKIKDDFINHPILEYELLSVENAIFLEELRDFLASSSDKSPYELIKNAINSNIYKNIQQNIAKKRSFVNTSFSQEKYEENIEKLNKRADVIKDTAKDFDDCNSFCNYLNLEPSKNSKDGIHLLTIHASKGLEFDKVFLIDLDQKRFPNTKLASRAGGIEEERRLFYVATTRAKEELYLSYVLYENGKKNKMSQFLLEAGFKES